MGSCSPVTPRGDALCRPYNHRPAYGACASSKMCSIGYVSEAPSTQCKILPSFLPSCLEQRHGTTCLHAPFIDNLPMIQECAPGCYIASLMVLVHAAAFTRRQCADSVQLCCIKLPVAHIVIAIAVVGRVIAFIILVVSLQGVLRHRWRSKHMYTWHDSSTRFQHCAQHAQ